MEEFQVVWTASAVADLEAVRTYLVWHGSRREPDLPP
jgi:hypothetical protein